MPSPKTHRRGGVDKNKKVARLSEKSSSFHGKDAGVAAEMIPRPRTAPDLLAGRRSAGVSTAVAPPSKLTKLLVHVTLLRSPGPVHVLVSPEATVKDLIDAALRQYVKEARRPRLPSGDAAAFDLHFSQFSLENPWSSKNSNTSSYARERRRRRAAPPWVRAVRRKLRRG